MKTAVVCGAGGFIGGHLVEKLKSTGCYVRGVDIKEHEFSPSAADEFELLDLRNQADVEAAVMVGGKPADEVYNLAADMGGMGFIHSAECEIMRNSARIHIHMIHAASNAGVGRYFFSLSVCIYRDMFPGEPEPTEDDGVPANPDNEYGWEKLYAERMETSGKSVTPKYVEGPVGVQSRNSSHARIDSLGWSAPTTLKEGISETYDWIEAEPPKSGLFRLDPRSHA